VRAGGIVTGFAPRLPPAFRPCSPCQVGTWFSWGIVRVGLLAYAIRFWWSATVRDTSSGLLSGPLFKALPDPFSRRGLFLVRFPCMADRKCRDCGKPFVWKQTEQGKWRPANENGSWHMCRKEPQNVRDLKSERWKQHQEFGRKLREEDAPF